MSETVWISKAPIDSRLLLPVTSDLEEPKGLINYWKANNAAESLDPCCPTEIWVKDNSKGDIDKLPDLSLIRRPGFFRNDLQTSFGASISARAALSR